MIKKDGVEIKPLTDDKSEDDEDIGLRYLFGTFPTVGTIAAEPQPDLTIDQGWKAVALPIPTVLSKGVTVLPLVNISVRAARGRPRKIDTDTKQHRDAPPERPVVPSEDTILTPEEIDLAFIDPLQTHCSVELRDAQDTDIEIAQMKKLLATDPLSKPKPKQISQYGPKFKSLWKWGDLRVREDVLYLK